MVDEFLSSTRKFIILSSKGMGKTHLLRQKRRLLTSKSHGKSAIFIPSSSGSDVDRQTSLPLSKSARFWKSFSQSQWAMIWEISISLSALLNFNLDIENDDVFTQLAKIADDENIPEDIKELILQKLGGEKISIASPTYILNSLLDMNEGELGKLQRKAPNLVLKIYPVLITSAVYIFIDSFDQTLSETLNGNTDHWVNGQTGLAMAAYNVFTNCSHIKVFTSIRQEAWNKFVHENKMAMESCCLELKYSKAEIRDMINFLVKYYENKENIADMFSSIQYGKIRNYGICGEPDEYVEESLFDYLFRHSLGSPRSMIHLISSIAYLAESSDDSAKIEKEIRKEVNLKSGSLAVTKIESEMAQFLTFLHGRIDQISFFSQIHNNILSYTDLKQISEFVNAGSSDYHPFCELYNLGLVGSLKRNADGELIQNFRSPLEFDWQLHNCLPNSKYYMLHPSISSYLANQYRLNFEPDILVDPEAIWKSEWDDSIGRRSVKIFISYSSKDQDLRDRLISALNQTFLMDGIRYEIWIDEKDISGGDHLSEKISQGIEWADIMISLISPYYLESKWCMTELDSMHTLEMNKEPKKVLAYMIGNAKREGLGNLFVGRLVPRINEDDASGLMIIGQEARKAYYELKDSQ